RHPSASLASWSSRTAVPIRNREPAEIAKNRQEKEARAVPLSSRACFTLVHIGAEDLGQNLELQRSSSGNTHVAGQDLTLESVQPDTRFGRAPLHYPFLCRSQVQNRVQVPGQCHIGRARSPHRTQSEQPLRSPLILPHKMPEKVAPDLSPRQPQARVRPCSSKVSSTDHLASITGEHIKGEIFLTCVTCPLRGIKAGPVYKLADRAPPSHPTTPVSRHG